MKMENNYLNIFYQNKRLIIQAHLSQNRTFCVVIKVVKHQCFVVPKKKTEWLWHLRFGYLKFRDLSHLSKQEMVKGLPMVEILEAMFKECV